MLCAAIDIGSNTTRVLVAEPQDGPAPQGDGAAGLHANRQGLEARGRIDADKVAEVAEVVATQVRLAEEVGAEAIRVVATAAIREATNRAETVPRSSAPRPRVEVLSEDEEGRLAFIGATKTLGTRSTARSVWSTSAAARRRSCSELESDLARLFARILPALWRPVGRAHEFPSCAGLL